MNSTIPESPVQEEEENTGQGIAAAATVQETVGSHRRITVVDADGNERSYDGDRRFVYCRPTAGNVNFIVQITLLIAVIIVSTVMVVLTDDRWWQSLLFAAVGILAPNPRLKRADT